jgi:HAD superfamily hydrolase (TIGR01509 family)
MVEAIVFDLYGVLAINGWQAFKALHFADRDDVWDQVYQLGRQVDAGLSGYAELIRFTVEATGENEETVRYQLEHTVANAELLEFIRTELLGRYKLGILSNANNDEVIGRIFTPEQQGIFDVVLLSHHVGMSKPDVHMYGVMAGKLDVPISECLFIDDREHHVAGAQAAGMQALLYTDIVGFKKDLESRL